MMTNYAELEKVEALLPDYQYIDNDSDDRIIVTVGLVATFFFWGGHTSQKRAALAECIEAYQASYGHQLAWACDPDSWKAQDLSKHTLPSFRDYIQLLDEDDGIEWYMSSGTDPEAVGDYSICCLTERGWNNGELSCLQLTVPRAHAFDGEKQAVFKNLLALCIDRLAPFHGNAGLNAITIEQEYTWEPEILDLTTRYQAVYAAEITTDSTRAPHGIKGVNWLTFVGDVLTEKLGGPGAFVAYCQRIGIEPTRLSNGFLVQAGALPQLGPVDEAAPEAYVNANAALRPLRDGNYGSMGSGSVNGELRFNRYTSDLWIRRFDMPGIWPPKTFFGLNGRAAGKAPTKTLKLATGSTCTLHGRYRPHPIKSALPDDEDDQEPTVVLLPGDKAPFLLRLGPHGEYLGRDAITWALVAEL